MKQPLGRRHTFDEARERREQDGTEYKLGAITQFLWKASEEWRMDYHSKTGETQSNSRMDTMDCASRSAVEDIEEDLTYGYRTTMHPDTKAFLEPCVVWRNGEPFIELSDAFIAIKSGTTKQGNSLKAPVHALHTYGFIPKKWLPLEPNMLWEDYHNPKRITKEMEDFAKESAMRLPIQYQQVSMSSFVAELKKGGLSMAVHAWPIPVNGIYPRTMEQFNHAIYGIKAKFFIKDSYLDPKDSDYIKELATDYRFFDWAYQLGIVAEKTDIQILQESGILDQLQKVLLALSKWLSTQVRGISGKLAKYG